MEKQLKIVRFAILGFGMVFCCVGLVLYLNMPLAERDYTLPTVFVSVGLLDMVIVFVWSVVAKAKAKKEQWLLDNGVRITAKFVSITLNTQIRVNGRNPFHIHCQWQDPITREVFTFQSKNIWSDPTSFIPASKNIEVLYDPNNMKSYMVDTGFLPVTV